MTEDELNTLTPWEAAQVIAGLSDEKAVTAVVAFVRHRNFPLNDFLSLIRASKGARLSYADRVKNELLRGEKRIQQTGQQTLASRANKYPALGFVSAVLKFTGWLLIIVGVLLVGAAIVALVSSPILVAAVLVGLGAVCMLGGVLCIAQGELINVLVDIEANTGIRPSIN